MYAWTGVSFSSTQRVHFSLQLGLEVCVCGGGVVLCFVFLKSNAARLMLMQLVSDS